MRNFVSLENLARGIECILHQFPGKYETYNLASPRGYTMAAVAEITKQVYEREFQRPLQVQIKGAEPVMTNHFSVSLDKLNNTGFSEDAKFTLETEIAEIFNYLKYKK